VNVDHGQAQLVVAAGVQERSDVAGATAQSNRD